MAVPLYDFAYFSGSAMEVGKIFLDLLGLGIPTGLLVRLDYRESNRQVVQRWYLSRRNLKPRMIAYFKIKLL